MSKHQLSVERIIEIVKDNPGIGKRDLLKKLGRDPNKVTKAVWKKARRAMFNSDIVSDGGRGKSNYLYMGEDSKLVEMEKPPIPEPPIINLFASAPLGEDLRISQGELSVKVTYGDDRISISVMQL